MSIVKGTTTIKITNEVHQKLLGLKIHPRESFNDVVVRLMGDKEVNPK